MTLLDHAVPAALRGYKREYLARDVIAGVTLSAIAIPEVLGYTSISQTPLVTGLYTIIFPTLVFALLGSSKLLVVGADSATAALLAAGLDRAGHHRPAAQHHASGSPTAAWSRSSPAASW